MHIYEGGDSSTMQEHLEQKGGEKVTKTVTLYFGLKSPQLLAVHGFYQSLECSWTG